MQTPAGCPRLLPVVQGVDAAAGGRPPADPTPTFGRLLVLAHDSPTRLGEDSRRTTRKGARAPEGVFHGADHPRRPRPSSPACGKPPATPYVRCHPRSRTSWSWPWMRRPPTRSCTGRAAATRSSGRLGPGRLGRGHRGGPRPSPATNPPATTDRLSSYGHGRWLLDRLVDEVRVERAALGTRVTLRRRIRSPSRPRGGGRQPSAGRAFS
jgi:hypothetical protein